MLEQSPAPPEAQRERPRWDCQRAKEEREMERKRGRIIERAEIVYWIMNVACMEADIGPNPSKCVIIKPRPVEIENHQRDQSEEEKKTQLGPQLWPPGELMPLTPPEVKGEREREGKRRKKGV